MPGSAAEQRVRAAFAEQAGWCRTLGSPLTAQLCDLMAERPWPDTAVADRLRAWSGDPRASADAVPLRLGGGLHALVRRHAVPELAACYPPHPLPAPDSMWPPLVEALGHADLAQWLDGPPQTNEVGRSSALIAGLLAFASRFPLPISLMELGASAGLNLQLDRFRFNLGERHIGDASSLLQITPEWHGAPPPAASLEIAARAGVDQDPLDPALDSDRLLAFVWADQVQRIAQLEAALTIARAHPVAIDRDNAASWLETQLSAEPTTGVSRVVMHSIAFQYFSLETQARVEAAIEQAGAEATERTPLGWLSFERDGPGRDVYLRLRTWPGGEGRLLARCHPHGASISWLDAPAH
ncbi:MAG: DUF2332 domain-containing protein [Sphingomicrobium sp.]|nr:DUF2332 family protein [Sphingomonadales bacterium]